MGYTAWMTRTWLFYILPTLSLWGVVGGTTSLVGMVRRQNATKRWSTLFGLPSANVAIVAISVLICFSAYSLHKTLVYSLWIPSFAAFLSVSGVCILTSEINQAKSGRRWAIAAIGIGVFQFVVYIVDRFFSTYDW
jgi:hypothetical protein